MVCAHFLASVLAAPRVVAVCRPGTIFQILANKFEGNELKPGTGRSMFIDSANLVFLLNFLSEKRRIRKGFISRLDFQTKVAIVEAVISLRQQSPAFDRMISERTLSESFIFVIDRAAHFMALLISSVIVIDPLSSKSILIGIVAAAAARILPIKSPFAKVVSK